MPEILTKLKRRTILKGDTLRCKEYWAIAIGLACSQANAAPKFDVEGRLELGVNYRKARNAGGLFFDAQLDLDTKRVQKTKAVIELEAESDQRQARFDEAFIDFKQSDESKIYVGYRRKGLGLGYERPRRRRFFKERTIVHKHLAELTYNGVEPGIRWRKKAKDQKLEVALLLPASKDYNANLSQTFALGSAWNTGYWALVGVDTRHQASQDLNYAFSWAVWIDKKRPHSFDLELAVGVDPFLSEIATLSDDGTAYYHGETFTYRYRFAEKGKEFWQGAVRVASLIADWKDPKISSKELSFGLQNRQEALAYHFDITIVADQNILDPRDFSYLRSEAVFELRVDL